MISKLRSQEQLSEPELQSGLRMLIFDGIFSQINGERLSLTLSWMSKEIIRWRLPTVELLGLDFLFIISIVFGLYSMHRLLAIKEQGEVEERVASEQIHMEIRKAVRNISNVAGIRDLFYFPYAILRKFLH